MRRSRRWSHLLLIALRCDDVVGMVDDEQEVEDGLRRTAGQQHHCYRLPPRAVRDDEGSRSVPVRRCATGTQERAARAVTVPPLGMSNTEGKKPRVMTDWMMNTSREPQKIQVLTTRLRMTSYLRQSPPHRAAAGQAAVACPRTVPKAKNRRRHSRLAACRPACVALWSLCVALRPRLPSRRHPTPRCGPPRGHTWRGRTNRRSGSGACSPCAGCESTPRR